MLDTIAHLDRLTSSEEHLQVALVLIPAYALLDILALVDRLIDMEELLPLVQDRDLKYVPLERILLLVPRHAQVVPQGTILLEELNPVRSVLLDIHVQLFRKLYVPLEVFLLLVPVVAHIVLLDTIAHLDRLTATEELLQVALVLVV